MTERELDDLDDLVNRCPTCEGRGYYVPPVGTGETCAMCRGSGRNPYAHISVRPNVLDYAGALLGGAAVGAFAVGFLGYWLAGETGATIGFAIGAIVGALGMLWLFRRP